MFAAAIRRATFSATCALQRWVAPQCAVCGIEPGDPVCGGCLQDFMDPAAPRCASCAAPLPNAPAAGPGAARCGRCLASPPYFDATLALGDYAPPLDGMVTALKSGGRLDLALVFGRLLADRCGEAQHGQGAVGLEPIGAVLAVPLHAARLRERGFNQSEQIAGALAAARRLASPRRALSRTRGGPAQQSLPLARRRANVRGAYALEGPAPARCVAVVDDVMTTGATLDEIARVLKAAGAARVVNLVVARTA